MRPQILLVGLGALTVGAALGALVTDAWSPRSTPPSPSAAPIGSTMEAGDARGFASADDVRGLRMELAALRRQNDEVLAAVRGMTVASSAGGAAALDPAEPAAVVREPVEVAAAAPVAAPIDLGDQVRAVVEELRRIEDEERVEAKEEKRARVFEKNLAAVAEQLGLEPWQTGELGKALQAEEEALIGVKERFRDSSDDDGRRQAMAAVRDQAAAHLGTFLNAEQLQTYQDAFGGRRDLFDRDAVKATKKAVRKAKKSGEADG